MKRAPKLFVIGFGVIAISLIAQILWWNSGENSVDRKQIHDAAVASAHLAPIPDPAYKAKTRGSIFSRTYWVAFTCSDAQFENFIASSTGLRDTTPYIFPFAETHPTPTTGDIPPEYMREAMREAEWFWDLGYFPSPNDSSFWNPSITRRQGRRYEIAIPDEAISGFLLRDDGSGEVFLSVSYS